MNNFSLKHVIDIVTDVDPTAFNLDNLKAIFRDSAWDELPDFLKLCHRTALKCQWQVFLIPQNNDKFTAVKHYHLSDKKISGKDVRALVYGKGYEITWGASPQKERLFSGCQNEWEERNFVSSVWEQTRSAVALLRLHRRNRPDGTSS